MADIQTINVPGWGAVDFPADMPDDQIAAAIKKNMLSAPRTEQPSPSTASVINNAGFKAVASLPDSLLNAPNNLINLGKAAIGTVTNLAGRPDLSPDLTPNPDLARRALEATGVINPNIVPKGSLQRGIDTVTQGVVGGALTGGASLPRTLAGAGMGGMSAGAAGATEALTGSPALAATVGLAAPAAAGRVMSSPATLRPQARVLQDEGVSMTPGQIRGGALLRAEEGATSWPILGDAIKSAQRSGIESFDRAAIQRSLDPIGERLPMGSRGHQAIEYARTSLGDAYESLLPNLRGELDRRSPTAPSFRDELSGIRQAGQSLPEPQRGQLDRIIQREIEDRFTQQGSATGQTLKNIESQLGELASTMRRSADYDVRTLGLHVQDAQTAMRRMVEDVNPNYAGELARINEGYANFKRVQSAAASVGAREGVFTPAQLQSAVRSGDRTKDRRAFSEGDALMQDLSGAGRAVLSPTVPDSGTPFRAALYASLKHPFLATTGALAGGIYSQPAQALLQQILTRQGNPIYGEVANRAAIPFGGAFADMHGGTR